MDRSTHHADDDRRRVTPRTRPNTSPLPGQINIMTIIGRWEPIFCVDSHPHRVVSRPHPVAEPSVAFESDLAVASQLPKAAAGY